VKAIKRKMKNKPSVASCVGFFFYVFWGVKKKFLLFKIGANIIFLFKVGVMSYSNLIYCTLCAWLQTLAKNLDFN